MKAVSTKPGLTPELKAWLDRVVVPALVREFLVEKSLAPGSGGVAECAPREEGLSAGVRE